MASRTAGLPDPAVGEVEIGLPLAPVRRLLPAAHDRVAVVADRRREALRKRYALAPELPPPVSDAHLVDAADAALVGVELEVSPVCGVAAHDRDAVGCPGHVHRRALYQVRPRVVPLDRRPGLARPRRPAWRPGLEGPFADQRLEPPQRLLCGWLVHRVAPSSRRRLVRRRRPREVRGAHAGRAPRVPACHPRRGRRAPRAETRDSRSGTSRSGSASAGGVAPKPPFAARRWIQAVSRPIPLAGAWSWKRLSATCSIFSGDAPILSRASSKLFGEGL